MHRIGLTADINKMYRAVELAMADWDLHRFVWRSSTGEVLKDYRMTRLTFGVSASSFAANMAVKQNAIDLCHKYPPAAETTTTSFYIDDCLTGADNVDAAIELQEQLQELFSRGGFILRKWNCSETSVLQAIPRELCESREVHLISDAENYTKTLGLEWSVKTD